jgi:RNA polymerase sigma-70 factor (ECF subfamily)
MTQMTQGLNDAVLITALKAGDEEAFVTLYHKYHRLLVNMATIYVNSKNVAEEVAQETWIAILEGLAGYKGMAAFKTWMLAILRNCAISRAQRENRVILWENEDDEPLVDPNRFLPEDHERWPHHWQKDKKPGSWANVPEDRLLDQETLTIIKHTIERLPFQQREVITLRDIEGWTAEEVSEVLGISQGNQRVLLHRARSKVRQILEDYLKEEF